MAEYAGSVLINRCERCRGKVSVRYQYPVADRIVMVCDICWRELTGRVYGRWSEHRAGERS